MLTYVVLGGEICLHRDHSLAFQYVKKNIGARKERMTSFNLITFSPLWPHLYLKCEVHLKDSAVPQSMSLSI